MKEIQTVLTERVHGLLDALQESGVKQVVLSPGSRSTPVAILLGQLEDQGKIKLYLDVDERSAAFFGLGLAKASGQPVLLVCTSGTAAANYYPAIWEANSSNIPLVVLTTDRPPELQAIGTPQTLDQPKMYSSAVKVSFQLPAPSESAADQELTYTTYIAHKAVAIALAHPRGPVHLNLPLRKPLMPDLKQVPDTTASQPTQIQLTASLSAEAQAQLTNLFAGKKGLIVAGPVPDGQQNAAAISAFAAQMNWPILADPLSGLRGTANALTTGDQIFKAVSKLPQTFQPEVILRTGATLVSAPVTNWLAKKSAPVVYLDADRSWRDHSLSTTTVVAADAAQILPQLSGLVGVTPDWFAQWQRLDQTVAKTLRENTQQAELTEPAVARVIGDNLPADSTLFVSNSMPIRDIDEQFRPQTSGIKVLCNRGADGIDGVNSTALGVAAHSRANYLYIGDLAFFHDLTGLMMARQYQLNLTVIVQNNNGGGIFSILPQYQEKTQFEKVFGTPLNLNLPALAQFYAAKYVQVTDADQLAAEIQRQPQGLTIVEVPVKRAIVPDEQNRLKVQVAKQVEKIFNEN